MTSLTGKLVFSTYLLTRLIFRKDNTILKTKMYNIIDRKKQQLAFDDGGHSMKWQKNFHYLGSPTQSPSRNGVMSQSHDLL